MKKVGIMTLYYKTYNYGAQLQAYALQKIIERLGYECEQICYKWFDSETEKNYGHFNNHVNKFREFAFSIPHSKIIYTNQNIYEAADEYDIFIAGSDQIWGIDVSMPYYFLPNMMLSFVPDEKVKIAYAASIGGAKLTTNKKQPIKYWTSKFDKISMREQSAIHEMSELSNIDVCSALDPSFLIEKSEWEQLANTADCEENNDEYILVYALTKTSEINKAAKYVSEKLNIPIKYISYDKNDTQGPIEFTLLVKNAKLILTNSFHGTVFSIIFNKQFYAFPNDNIQSDFSKNIRITDLLSKLKISDRYISRAEEVSLSDLIDYEKVNINLEKERKSSLDFLAKSLAIEKEIEATVIDKRECVSCGVCAKVCPQNCISFKMNDYGFKYPVIDKKECIDCGICTARCPVINTNIKNINKTYAAINKSSVIRKKSSSGGAFSAFAEYVIERGGVVFGVKNDENFNAIHSYTESIDGIEEFRGSKYVQSDLKNTFEEAKNFLEQGRLVLFSGCGCQINALRAYLNQDYENLITIDLVCISVTSPVFREKYIEEHVKKYGKLIELNERTKDLGYLAPGGPTTISASITDRTSTVFPSSKDIYKGTRYNWSKQSCFDCKVRKSNHYADISIGDLFGILAPEFDDGNGISLIVTRSEDGERLLSECEKYLEYKQVLYDDVVKYNGRIETGVRPCPWRDYIVSLSDICTASELYYEHMLCAQNYSNEALHRDVFIRIARNSLLAKITKYNTYGCLLEYEPCMSDAEKIFIYGAGKIGKIAAKCSGTKLAGFVDSSDKFSNFDGVKIYKIDDPELIELASKINNPTFLITPVWDYEEIYQKIKIYIPNSRIVSIEEVVDKIEE